MEKIASTVARSGLQQDVIKLYREMIQNYINLLQKNLNQ